MKQVKGFLTINNLVLNDSVAVSLLGEISTWSLTYTVDRRSYTDENFSGFALESLFSLDDQGQQIELSSDVATHIFDLSQKLITFSETYSGNVNKDDIAFYLESAYTGSVTDVIPGNIVATPGIALPEFIQWKHVPSDTFVRIWYSDDAFKNDFDEYKIVVVPPFDNIDDFFQNPEIVKQRLEAMTPETYFGRVERYKSYNPETYIKTIEATYVRSHVNQPTYTAESYWSVIIYGEYGNNIDAIKDAITEYILANTTHTEDEWFAILPELFERTEFVFVPSYHREAIPNMTIMSGVFSPLTPVIQDSLLAKQYAMFYPEQHTVNVMSVLAFPYRSLLHYVIGGYRNRESKFFLNDFLPDFINVSTSSLDFNRMSLVTKEWVLKMERAIQLAEDVTTIDVVRKPYRKAYRLGRIYIAFVHDNVQYLVLTQSSRD